MKTSDQLQTMALTYAEICQGETPWVALGNFLNDWFDDAKDRREQLVIEPIALPSQLDRELPRWAAFCAASVEWLCTRYSVPCPSWASDPAYTLAEPWFDDPHAENPQVRDWLLHYTPEPFRRRNVYCVTPVKGHHFSGEQSPASSGKGGMLNVSPVTERQAGTRV